MNGTGFTPAVHIKGHLARLPSGLLTFRNGAEISAKLSPSFATHPHKVAPGGRGVPLAASVAILFAEVTARDA
jgi:hypothetical protein